MERTDSRKEDQVIISALKFLCGKYKHICRLCLCSTNNKINLDDKIDIQTPYYTIKSVSYFSMLEDLSVQKEHLLPNIICDNCRDVTTQAYIFQKLKQYAFDKWSNILQLLSNALSHSNSVEPDHNAVHILLDKDENLMLPSYKLFSEKPKTNEVLRDVITSYRKYNRERHRMTDFQCNECGKKFRCYDYLSRHKKRHNRSPIPCTKCFKTFLTSAHLEEHMERLHYPKRVECIECSKKFGTKRILKMHQRMYHTPASCKQCNIHFDSKLQLRVHRDRHGAGTCPRCDKKFSSQRAYSIHIKHCTKTDKVNQKYICDICHKCYLNKNGIVTHLGIDHGFAKKVVTCKWCHKKFDALSRLKSHIVKHTKERNFHCEQCGGLFVTKAALTYHIRLHTGERPYPCDMCDESFLSSSRRMEHKRRKHIGPTKECNLCERSFLTKYELKCHMKRHFNPNSKLYITDMDH